MSGRRDDRGTTLVEMLIAVMILGLVFVAVLSSMGTSTIASGLHRSQANAHAVLLSAVERLKSPTEVAYGLRDAGGQIVCPATAAPHDGADFPDYLTAIRSVPVPAGWDPVATISMPNVEYWDGTTFQSTCYDGTPILRLQLITITVVDPDGKVSESLDIVKRGT